MKSCHMIRSIRIRYRVEYGLAARPTGRFYSAEVGISYLKDFPGQSTRIAY